MPPATGTNAGLAFGTQGLMQAMQGCRDLELDKALAYLFDKTSAYTGGVGRHDDTSVVLLERFAT